MTQRIKGLMVVFKEDIREDDVDKFIGMISMFPFIAEVKKSELTSSDDAYNRSRIRVEYWNKIKKALEE